MLNSLSLKQKILGGGLLPLLFVGLVNVIGLINFNGVVESYDQVSHTHQVTEMGSSIEKAALNMQAGERGYLLTGNDTYLEPYTQGSQAYQGLFRDLKQITTDKESFNALVEAEKTINSWKGISDQYIQKRKDLVNSPHANDIMGKLVGERKGKQYFDAFRAQMQLFDTREKVLLDIRVKDADAVTGMTNKIIILGTAIALFLAVIIVIFIIKMIITPITMIKEAALKISKGETDVHIEVEGRDEIGQMAEAFKEMINSLSDIANIAHQIGKGNFTVAVTKRSENDVLGEALENMVTNLNAIMVDLKEGTFALNSATAEILATTSQVSSGASQTFSALTQTSASIEQ
ncbi:MAG: CHASE3 domain-containing protein, partial [Campylobacterales bacterium]|nr:CHASE3 domain-containing protein [Campylobacterales bacterium]